MLREWLLSIPYIQQFGYLIVFFAALLEAVPAVGLFIPGQTIVILAGLLAYQGVLSVQFVLALAIIGAILGDLAGYLLGRKYGVQLIPKREGMIKDVAELLRQHPIKTLIIGRFNSITRAFAPFAAGASRVRMRSFLFANIIGGVLWGVCFVTLGLLAGAGYELAAQSMDTILLSGVLISGGVLLAYYYLKKHAGVSHRATILLIANVLAITLFIAVTYSLLRGNTMLAADTAIQQQLASIHNGWVDSAAITFTNILQLIVVSMLSVIIFIFFWRHNKREASLFAFVLVSGLFLDKMLKELFMRVRPVDGLLTIETYSFPSGHAMLSTILLGAFVLIYRKYTSWKNTFVAVAATLVILISFSRLYVGVHWFSDVLGGIAFGLFWLTFVFLTNELFDSYKEDRRRRHERFTKSE